MKTPSLTRAAFAQWQAATDQQAKDRLPERHLFNLETNLQRLIDLLEKNAEQERCGIAIATFEGLPAEMVPQIAARMVARGVPPAEASQRAQAMTARIPQFNLTEDIPGQGMSGPTFQVIGDPSLNFRLLAFLRGSLLPALSQRWPDAKGINQVDVRP